MTALSPRARWLIACAVAPAVPASISCATTDPYLPIAVYGISFGALQALALGGGTSLRVRWFAFTTTGALGAFPLGFLTGLFVYLSLGSVIGLSGLGAAGTWYEAAASVLLIGAMVIGALAGGALVGTLQKLLLREARGWIVRTAFGGVVLLPASLAAMYASTTSGACQGPFTTIAGAGIAGFCGLLYGLLTVGRLTPAATPSPAFASARYPHP